MIILIDVLFIMYYIIIYVYNNNKYDVFIYQGNNQLMVISEL